ncbi:MAG: MarR family winged helix-turn-helix transcriptional regulator [Candidatus Dormibacteria bacterium]
MPSQSSPRPVPPATPLRILIGRLSRRLRQTAAGADLTPTQLAVLATVVRDGPLGIAPLAQREGVNPTMLSRIVGKLCDRGLVARRVDPQDARAATVIATERGRRLQRRIGDERSDLLSRRLQALPSRQRQLLAEAIPALEALADALLVADE